MFNKSYNPDVLTCLANLSSDEVFTPPHIVNQMLDLLPQKLFRNKNTTFLDPTCKSGAFLREITKRLMEGLKDEIPGDEERRNHIFNNQLYGIGITELTALLSRRSVYCSKTANGGYSVAEFDDEQGNIKFERIEHNWIGGKCSYCGANKEKYERDVELETHAYQFIHTDNPETIFNMRFDVIIGNPPYQLNVGVEQDNYAVPLYHLFVEKSKNLNPRFLSMIIPSRWFSSGRGLDTFREEMLNDKRLRVLVDYPNSSDCFPGIDLSGGVCYFLWERESQGDCNVIEMREGKIHSKMIRPLLEENARFFVRFNDAISILRKVASKKEPTFDSIVSPQTPFGILSSFNEYSDTPFKNSVKVHTVKGDGYISEDQVLRNKEWVSEHKVYISKSYGERGNYPFRLLAKPFYGEPNSCCSQTYLMIGPLSGSSQSSSIITYIHTKFFRFLVMLNKNTQDAMRKVYSYVPIQNFDEEWTDEKLYKKYGLNQKEIDFIESMIRPMEGDDE